MRSIVVLLGLCFAILTSQFTAAGECGCAIKCPHCRHVCKLTCEEVNEKKHCWQVECKPICIPRVKFPWEKCSDPPKCARLKYVYVLKKIEFECPSCKYVWHPVCKSCTEPCEKCAEKSETAKHIQPPVLTTARPSQGHLSVER